MIAILAIFLAGRFGIVDFSGVPVLNSIFPSPKITVGVVGRSSYDMRALLESEDYRVTGVYFAGDIDQKVIYPGVLNNFDVIILQGESTCDRTARKVIADRVKAGGKLIVVGDACTRVSDDRAAYGWDIGIGSLGDVVPVVGGGVTKELEMLQTNAVRGKFKVVAVNHPVFNGVKNFGFDSEITAITVPKPNAEILAYIDASSIGKVTAPSLFAIVESKGLFSGKTIYFAFDPATVAAQGTGRNMFLNTLLYLRGAKG
ncbi:MAG: hypothetical protein AABW54_02735 [Candidatus Micrarchaeota archaeon]